MRVVEQISECKKLWQQYSPNETLWDLWEVVLSQFNASKYSPHFIVADDKGLLPLWRDNGDGQFNFFGGDFPEDRKFWFEPNLFAEFYKAMPENTVLFDINGVSKSAITQSLPDFERNFTQGSNRYLLDLRKVNHDIELYFKTFGKKHKKNFRNDLKKLAQQNFSVRWGLDENFDRFVELNILRFGDESDLKDPVFVEAMRLLVKVLSEMGMLHTAEIVINGKIEGIEFGALYKKVYYVINGGSNRNIKNLGKQLILEHIKKAIELKADIVDFLSGDTGWKQLWNFEVEPYFEFRK